MNLFPRALVVLWLIVSATSSAHAQGGATLLRLFLPDGTSLVSFGEYARLEDRIVFSMPAGGPLDQPRLHVVSLPAAAIDWPRTEAYAASARGHWYAETRGEADFERLSTDVARVLNEIASSTNRRRALDVAERARRTLADWPSQHFGYRRADVLEIVGLLDEAISNLRASLGITEFELEFVATAPDAQPLEPLLGMPAPREQLDQVLRVARLTYRPRDRVALLRTALALIDDPAAGLTGPAVASLRNAINRDIRREESIDAKYADMARRLMRDATRAAEDARIDRVERVIARIPVEDARLGRRRPDEVQALRASVQARLEDARQLRLLQHRWTIRQAFYRRWRRSAGAQMLQLVKLEPVLTSIKRLEGPAPDVLEATRRRLWGGADRLQRIGVDVPADFRPANDLLVGAWRFAESAVTLQFSAAAAGSLALAREASSAAAAALLTLERAQQEIRTLIEPPSLK